MKKFLSLASLVITALTYSQVGVNTDTPQATLDVNGNVIVQEAKTVGDTEPYSLVVRSTSNGELKIVDKPTEPTKPFTLIKYEISNPEGDWLRDLNTNIPVDQYTLTIINTQFLDTKGAAFGRISLGNKDGKTYVITPKVELFKHDGKWRIKADYDSANTIGGTGYWEITVLVSKNTTTEVITVPIDLRNSNSGSTPKPATL